jgi:hypothetical protein
MEVLKEQPELVEVKQKVAITKPLFKKFSVEEKHPDVWESAKLIKTIDEFDKLIGVITFEKKDLGWIVAANLVDQYLQNFESAKDFSDTDKHQWFKDCINKHSEEREAIKKKVADEPLVNEKKVTTPKQEEVKTVVTESVKKTEEIKKPFDAKKYEAIITEGNKGRLNALCGDFLLETTYGTLESRKEELAKMLKQHKNYSKAKPSEISNYIAKLGKINGAIGKLA